MQRSVLTLCYIRCWTLPPCVSMHFCTGPNMLLLYTLCITLLHQLSKFQYEYCPLRLLMSLDYLRTLCSLDCPIDTSHKWLGPANAAATILCWQSFLLWIFHEFMRLTRMNCDRSPHPVEILRTTVHGASTVLNIPPRFAYTHTH